MPNVPIVFNYADVKSIALKNKTGLKTFIFSVFKREKKRVASINYIFCSDQYLLQINKDFLLHDYYTDIITFDLSDKNAIVGEIYISVDRVKDNANVQGTSFSNELLRVMFHGVLHLCGYGDKTKSEITVMRQKEDYYLLCFDKLNK